MDNARKKYVNIEMLSSGDIYVLLDSVKSKDKGEIENLINDSDTEFVTENETAIPNNDNMNEGNTDHNSYISVPEASIHILPMQSQEHDNEVLTTA